MMSTSNFTWRYIAFGNGSWSDQYALADWLTLPERQTIGRLRHLGRRAGWLASRVLAKQLILDRIASRWNNARGGCPLRVEITTIGPDGDQVRPVVHIDGRPTSWPLSITHTEKGALVVLAAKGGAPIGTDLVVPANYGSGFCRLWFTDLERDWIGTNRAPHRVALIWAVKEAAYKACHRAEPFHPRKIEVLLCPSGQIGLWYGPTATAHLARTWRIDRQVAAIVQAGSAY